jgi:hypothetical protein
MDDPQSECPCCGRLAHRAWSRRKVLAAAGLGAAALTAPRFACADDIPSIAYESVPERDDPRA